MKKKVKAPVNPHRNFYVDGVLEFACFYDHTITDKKIIIENFIKGNDWKFHCSYFELKLDSCGFNKDLTEVYIKTKPK